MLMHASERKTVGEQLTSWFGEGSMLEVSLIWLILIIYRLHGAVRGGFIAQHYIDEALQPVLVPYLAANHPTLMQDNARPHTAKNIHEFSART